MLSTICFSLAGGAFSVAQMLAALIKALLLTAMIAGAVVVAVACWAVIAQLFVGGALITLFSLATMPSKAVRK